MRSPQVTVVVAVILAAAWAGDTLAAVWAAATSAAGLQAVTLAAASSVGAISSVAASVMAVTAGTDSPGVVSGGASAGATWARHTGTTMATTRAGSLSMFGRQPAGNGSAYGFAAEWVVTKRRERALSFAPGIAATAPIRSEL